ncbi:hypothetical protein LENED_002223 [Lentinula edodes]|uniref:Uncharacterized protein n=1 Tax=Lentinula edodes TaxID=5353 RepID=A0A1Q3E0Z3_LENED|nr:hypothetical protein LENED_002223 [Lentinula edodes]
MLSQSMDQQAEDDTHLFSPQPQAPPIESSADQNPGLEVELSLASSVAIQVANFIGLSQEHRAILLHISQDIPNNSQEQLTPMFWALGILLKNREDSSLLRADIILIQNQLRQMHQSSEENVSLSATQKTDVLNACKNVVYGPRRMSYHNTAIVSDVLRYLNQNSSQNSFRAHFENPSSTFGQVLNKYIRDKASYAKNIIKDEWIRSMNGGVTKSAEMIAETMVGSTVNIGLQHTGRLLLAESKARGHLISLALRMMNFSPTRLTRTMAMLSLRGSGMTSMIFSSGNLKLIKKPGRAYGANFISVEWVEFYKQRAAYEMEMFPDDKIAAIPRVQPESVPQPSSMMMSGAAVMQTPQTHRSNILIYPTGQFSSPAPHMSGLGETHSPTPRMSGPALFNVFNNNHSPALSSHGQSSPYVLGMNTPTNVPQTQGRNTPIGMQGQMGMSILGSSVGGVGNMFNGTSSGMSGGISSGISGVIGGMGDRSDGLSGDASDGTSSGMNGGMSGGMSGGTSGGMSGRMNGGMSGGMNGGMSGGMSRDLLDSFARGPATSSG